MARTALTYPRATSDVVPPVSVNPIAPTLNLPLTTSVTAGVTIPSGSVSASRAGVQWCPNESGVYSQFTANVLSFNTLGVFVEPGRTNVCTNYNADPGTSLSNVTASGGTLSAFTDVAGLAAAGLANICSGGKVFRLVNASGSSQTVTITGIAGSASVASIRAWARAYGGTASMALNNGATTTGSITIQATDALVEYRKENITHTDANDQIQFTVPNGVTLDFILNQLEIGPNTTTPIVTTGASAARSSVIITLPNSGNIPANDFTLYCECTPYGYQQDTGGAVPLSAYVDANNLYQITTGAPPQARRTIAGVAGTSNARSAAQTETMKLAARWARAGNSGFWINGGSPTTFDTATTDLSLASGNFNIGRKGDNSQYFTGRIRNVKIFSYPMSDAMMRQITTPDSWNITFVPNYGAPCYGTVNTNRIYAMAFNTATSAWKDIYYSTDFGNTWTLYATTSTSTQETICADASENLYFATSTVIKRIAATNQAETSPITFSPVRADYTWQNWHFTVDNEGNIYIGQYSLTGTQNQKLWISTNSGTSFTGYDVFNTISPLCRHFHSIKVNPFTNQLYAVLGDDTVTTGNVAQQRGTFRSKATSGVKLTALDATTATNPVSAGSMVGTVATITCTAHGIPLASTCVGLVAGVTPTNYNGLVQLTVVDANTLSYNVSVNAGVITVAGTLKYSTDFDLITPPHLPGPTGVTFTSEAAYFSTDGSGSQNYVQYVTSASTTAAEPFTMPNPLQISPLLWCAAYGDSELWVTFTEDDLTKSEWSGLFKLTKLQGVDGQWQPARVISVDSAKQNASDYYQVSVSNRGVIPTGQRFIYVSRRSFASSIAGPRGFYRILR